MGIMELPRKHSALILNYLDSEDTGPSQQDAKQIAFSLCLLSKHGTPASHYDKQMTKRPEEQDLVVARLVTTDGQYVSTQPGSSSYMLRQQGASWLRRLYLWHQLLAWLFSGASPTELIRSSTLAPYTCRVAPALSLLLVD